MSLPGFNWTMTYSTAEAIEKDLVGLVYRGPGWYQSATDTALIGVNPSGTFTVTVWNVPNARQIVLDGLNKLLAETITQPVYDVPSAPPSGSTT